MQLTPFASSSLQLKQLSACLCVPSINSAMTKPAAASASPSSATAAAAGTSKPPPEITEKLRFLCLHGYRQNADSFRAKIGSFRKTVNRYAEFVFISAPHVAAPLEAEDGAAAAAADEEQRSWWFNKDDGTFKGTNQTGPAFGFGESVAEVERAWREQGPFQGLLGFSQGACFVALLCNLAQRDMTSIRPQFAFMVAGFRSGSLAHIGYYEPRCDLPSFHVWGTGDQIIEPSMSEALADAFRSPVVHNHEGGHFFACGRDQKTAYVDQMRDWLQAHLEREELRRAEPQFAAQNGHGGDDDEDDDEEHSN